MKMRKRRRAGVLPINSCLINMVLSDDTITKTQFSNWDQPSVTVSENRAP